MPNILALWPIIKWALQALGFMGPEDVEKEREFKLRLLEAQERKDAAMITAWADFQKLWRPPAERVYVWANTVIALFQPAVLTILYIDALRDRRAVQLVVELNQAGVPGLIMLAVYFFPFYGAAFVPGVAQGFGAAMSSVLARVKLPVQPSAPTPPTEPSPIFPLPSRPSRPGREEEPLEFDDRHGPRDR